MKISSRKMGDLFENNFIINHTIEVVPYPQIKIV